MEEFVGAIICIISPRATSTDDDDEGDDDADVAPNGHVGHRIELEHRTPATELSGRAAR